MQSPLNPAYGDVYSIQHYVIKFVCALQQVCVFFLGTLVSSTNKTDRDITEILLKVALNTITPNPVIRINLLVLFTFMGKVMSVHVHVHGDLFLIGSLQTSF